MKLKYKIKEIKFRIYYISIFKIKTFVRRKINNIFNFNRPASNPFITGDGFRALAQHVFDELSEIKTDNVQSGDIVFVRGDFLHDYFKKIHPKIKNPYILISHNSDQNIGENYEKYIDEKIIHWFAQNVLMENKKITPIPIGLQLRMYDNKNKIVELLTKYKNSQNKIFKIFYSFSSETNLKRSFALPILKANKFCEGIDKQQTREKYYLNLSRYTFTASPEGGGVDCHRTWESLYLKTIPIVEKNSTTKYWFELGLPVLLIDSWNEIDIIDETFIQSKYRELKDKFDSPVLYMEYWLKEIIKYKK